MDVAAIQDAPWWANVALTLLVTGLVTWGSVLVATRGQRRDSAALVREVKNGHVVPLRDDLDAKVAALADGLAHLSVLLGRLADTQQATREDIRETRRDIGGLRADARADRVQVAALRGRVEQITDQMAGGRQ